MDGMWKAAAITALAVSACATQAQEMSGTVYEVTVINDFADEMLAPILITDVVNDAHIFLGSYVTPQAEEQILTGDPARLLARIGEDAHVGHGSGGAAGVLLAAGASVTFEIVSDATALRVLAKVAPSGSQTVSSDNYLSNVVDLHAKQIAEVGLERFDAGYDEGTLLAKALGSAPVVIRFRRK